MPDSPLDPLHDFATYRVACPACNEAVWASYSPPPVEGENLLAGHECPGPLEAQIEPGTNGNAEMAMPEAVEPLVEQPLSLSVAEDAPQEQAHVIRR